MVIEEYSAHIYCDGHHPYEDGTGELPYMFRPRLQLGYIDGVRNYTSLIKVTKGMGWKIDKEKSLAFCPSCTKNKVWRTGRLAKW